MSFLPRTLRPHTVSLADGFALPDGRLLLLLLVGLAAAAWPSLSSLLPLAAGDTPLSFVPLVPVVGTYFLWRGLTLHELRQATRDTFLDGIALSILLAAAALLLVVLPAVMSWDYWLSRFDIPGLVILLAALLVGAWGIPALTRLWPALLYFLLAWPLPYLLIDNTIIPLTTRWTAQAVRALAPLLPLGIRPAHDLYTLVVPYRGHEVLLTVAQACAGVNGTVGLAIIALPVAAVARGDWELRAAWLGLGLILSWIMNILRILLLAAATAMWGAGPVMKFLHPEAGVVLFALSFLLLLLMGPLLQVDLSPLARRPSRAKRRPEWWKPRHLLLLAALLVGAWAAEGNLSQFTWLSTASLPAVSLRQSRDVMSVPPGWRVQRAGSISGWKSLFGPSTVSSVMTLQGKNGQNVLVQAILTKDISAFDTYGVENCYVFHGDTLRQVRRVLLGSGLTGTLIDFSTASGDMSTVYWLQPVSTPNGTYHERIALIADARSRRLPRDVPNAPIASDPLSGFAGKVAQLLSPWVGGHAGPTYNSVNAELQALAADVIAQERSTSK